jgi:hypothetical protein
MFHHWEASVQSDSASEEAMAEHADTKSSTSLAGTGYCYRLAKKNWTNALTALFTIGNLATSMSS